MNKEKIKLIRTTTVGLTLEVLLRDQLDYLNDLFDLKVVASNDDYLLKLKEETDLSIHPIHMKRDIGLLDDLKSLKAFYSFLKKENPVILHSSTPKSSIVSMVAGFLARVPIRIYTVTGVRYQTEKGLKRLVLKSMEKLTALFATHVNTEGPSVQKFYLEENVTRKKLEIIGHGSLCGVDLNKFSKESLIEEKMNFVKNQIDYQESDTYILAVGRLVKDKGIENLVNSFTALRNEGMKGLKLILLGPFERNLDALSEEVEVEIENNPNIIHISWSEDVEYFLALSDLLVHASFREGFPNVPLQAGALGCPVICSEIPGNTDIVKNKKTGLYFEAGNTSDLLDKIRYAINNRDEMTQYAKNLQKEVTTLYSREFIHQELDKYYNDKLSELK